MQALVDGFQQGAGQLVTVGDTLYYVMLAQVGAAVGTPPATNFTLVYKSTDKTTWTLKATNAGTGAPLQTNASRDCPCVVIGTKIYICTYQLDSSAFPPINSLLL